MRTDLFTAPALRRIAGVLSGSSAERWHLSSPGRRRLALAAIMIAAAALRAWPAREVFTAHGVQLTGDDDAAYHVLQAERILRGAPGAPWFDPGLNYPAGARVPWPPLFDMIIAGTARMTTMSPEVPRNTVAAVASVIPIVIALATIPIVFLLAETLVGAGGLEAALVIALLPVHATFSMLGRADQHVLELLVSSLAFLAVSRGLLSPSAPAFRPRVLLGIALAAAFWTWPGAALYPLLLVGFASVLFVAAPADDPAARRLAGDLGVGGAIATVGLAVTLSLARGPAALGDVALSSVTGFHVGLLALVTGFGGALLLSSRATILNRTRLRRAACVLSAGVAPLALAMQSAGFREAVVRGLTALTRANAWYATIMEFDPLVFYGHTALRKQLPILLGLYGLALLVMPLAGFSLVQRLRRRERPAAALVFLLAWGAAFLGLSLIRHRFTLYLIVPLAIWIGAGVRDVATRAGRPGSLPRLATALGLMAVIIGPALASVPTTLAGENPIHAHIRSLLERVPALPAPPDRPAVYTEWSYGHLVQYAAGRPTLVSPFGTEGGDDAMEDSATFFLSVDATAAYDVLDRRRVGILVLGDPGPEVCFAAELLPPVSPVCTLERTVTRGVLAQFAPRVHQTVPARLWEADGSGTSSEPALDRFRLLDETQPVRLLDDDTGPALPAARPLFKTFGIVRGAVIRTHGGRPSTPLFAVVKLRTASGREFDWTTHAIVSPAGTAELRVPYATGMNGRVWASELVIGTYESEIGHVVIREQDVLEGESLAIQRPERTLPALHSSP